MRSQLRVGDDWPPVICGRCQRTVTQLTRSEQWEEPPYRYGGLLTPGIRYWPVDVEVSHQPCGCTWQVTAGEVYTVYQPREEEERPIATCSVCRRPAGAMPAWPTGCQHFTLLSQVLVPPGSWLVGWPTWEQLGPGDYWISMDRVGPVDRYQLWRGWPEEGARLEGALYQQTIDRMPGLYVNGARAGDVVAVEDFTVHRGEDATDTLPAPVDSGYRYSPFDEDPFDLKPNACWRCCATEVPSTDVIGLCPPCLADLKGRKTE